MQAGAHAFCQKLPVIEAAVMAAVPWVCPPAALHQMHQSHQSQVGGHAFCLMLLAVMEAAAVAVGVHSQQQQLLPWLRRLAAPFLRMVVEVTVGRWVLWVVQQQQQQGPW